MRYGALASSLTPPNQPATVFLDPTKPIEKHRYRLPHWHQDGVYVFVTWRLADSLPTSVISHISKTRETFLKTHPKPWDQKTATEYQRRFIIPLEDKLDESHGSCCLRQHHAIVADAFHHFDKERYLLDSFVVMPNHVHALFALKEGRALEDILHSLKSFTANQINKALNRSGKLWQKTYWDRLIRSSEHFKWTREYIAGNPKNHPKSDYHLWQK